MKSIDMLPSDQNKPRLTNEHLANERTFLAWIRTCISLMAFGFVIVKFALFIQQISVVFGHKPVPVVKKGFSAIVGVSMVALGAILTVLAYLRYRKIENQLNNNELFPTSSLTVLLAIFVIVASVLLVIYLLPNI